MTDLSVALVLFGLICCVILVAMLVVNQKPTSGMTYGSKQQSSNESDYDDVSDEYTDE